MKKFIILTLTASAIFIVGFCFLYINILNYSQKAEKKNPVKKIINISKGKSFDEIAGLLEKNRIIYDKTRFIIFARIKGFDVRVKAGEYFLSSGMSPVQILDILSSGKAKVYRVTIPEGYTIKQISKLVKKTGFDRNSEFLQDARNPLLVKKMGFSADTFEGYLFPDTYFFNKSISNEKMISIFVNRFKKIFTKECKKRAKKLGFNTHEIITLASIIEKETAAAKERGKISSVFHSRLKKKMRLETDPTVIYGIKDFDGNITKKHLQTVTPYNTYKIKGLPPGPIANPGKEAIMAALYPDKTHYLFFVAKGDKSHYFSTTLKEHNRAVKKYQKRKQKR